MLPIEFQPYFDADILSTVLIKFLQQESNSFPLDTFVRLAESKAKQSKLKDTVVGSKDNDEEEKNNCKNAADVPPAK